MADVIRFPGERPRKPRPPKPEHRRRDAVRQIAEAVRKFMLTGLDQLDPDSGEMDSVVLLQLSQVKSDLDDIAKTLSKIDREKLKSVRDDNIRGESSPETGPADDQGTEGRP